MIRMTRVRLINWHNFVDSCLDVKMITYLVGVNAVGKTTIMDAIRYCLTTNKNFNTAGNKKSERTLQGSVHGKQRAVNVYSRPGHRVSYIGVEFYDELNLKSFVITVRVESEGPDQPLRHVSQDWYLSKAGITLEDLPFIVKNQPATREQFRLSDKKNEPAPTQKEAKKRISRILGVGESDSPLGKKFHEVFHMGTSLEDITDIRQFIYTYILPEPEMNLDTLQGDMRELEHLSEVLTEAQKREEYLSDIISCLDKARMLDGRVRVVELLIQYAKWQESLDKNQYCEQEIAQNMRVQKAAAEAGEELEIRRVALNEKRDAAISNLKQNTEAKAIEYLEGKEKELLGKCREIRIACTKLKQAMSDLRQIEELLKAQDFVLTLDAGMLEADIPVAEKRERVNILAAELGTLAKELKGRGYQFWNKLETIADDLRENSRKLTILKSGVMTYPTAQKDLKEAINAELLRRGMPAEARIFCELLYMTDESWQDCVESYLGNQRFHILVPPRYYPVAKEVFIQLGQQVGRASLIDTVRLERDWQKAAVTQGEYLANKIDSKNPYARMYIRYLLRDIVCCEKETDLESHPRSVTRDLLRYQSYSLSRMRGQDQYIGVNARKRQIAKLEKQQQEMIQEQKKYEKQQSNLNELEKCFNPFVQGNKIDDIYQHLEAPERLDELENRTAKLKDEIAAYKKNPVLRAMYNQIDALDEDLKSINDQCADQKAKVLNAQQSIKKLSAEQQQNRVYIAENQQAYEAMSQQYPEYREEALARYQEHAVKRSPAEIAQNQISGNALSQSKNRRDQYLQSVLIPKQNDYNSLYACDYAPGLPGEDAFRIAHASLVNIDLEKYKEDLRQAQIRCEARFRKDILFRLRDDITEAKQQFKQLRRVMDQLAYGEEQYRFHVEGCKEGELKEFYQIIMDEKNEEMADESQLSIFKANRDEVYESQVHDFMDRIITDAKNSAEARAEGKTQELKSLSHYVDYRTYLEYDLLVKNLTTGYEVPLSKVSGDGSGGENQAPFYVAICASFLQIYEQSENSIRLMLLDEAFNRMTSDRIEPMMKMFEQLNMQVLLISTVEKCSAIYPYCDLTYSIVKVGNRNSIGIFDRDTEASK